MCVERNTAARRRHARVEAGVPLGVPVDGELRSTFRKAFPAADWQAIESGGTGGGIPDANFCWQGVEGWIEFKRATGWAVRFRPMQVPWLMRRARAGGHVLVAVRQVRRGGDSLWIFHGAQAYDLSARGLRGPTPLGCWAQPWPWEAVARVVFTRWDARA